MKKRILGLTVVLAMCLTMLPIPAGAAEPVDITEAGLDIWPGRNGSDGPTPSATYKAGTGTVEWDLDTLTLTLTDATLNGTESKYGNTLEIVAPSESYPTVTIVLHGTNTITGKDNASSGNSRGIYSQCPLRFSGDGTLTTTGKNASSFESAGITAFGLTVEQGITITAVGGSGYSSYGVDCTGTLTVGGTLNAQGNDTGILIDRAIVVEEGGVLEARGKNVSSGYGINLNGSSDVPVTVNGTLIAVGAAPFGKTSVGYQNKVIVKGAANEGGTLIPFETAPTSFTPSVYASTKYVQITPDSKAPQESLTLTSSATAPIRYGDTFTLTATGGSGDGAITWTVKQGNAEVSADGTVKVTGVGDITITATKAGGTDYADTSADYTFTAQKAIPDVGAVTCTGTIHPGTAPASVALTRTDATVPGTLALAEGTSFTLGSKEYGWVFTPENQTLYESASGKITLTVTTAPLSGISVTTQPTRTAYTFGETFDPAGMVVTATYADGTTAIVTPEFDSALTVGQTSIVLSYTEGEVTETCILSGLTVSKKAGPALSSSVSVRYDDTDPHVFTLSDLLPADCGAVNSVTADFDASGIIASAAGDKDAKTVTWALKSDLESAEQSAVLTITVETENYSNITVAVTVRTTVKTPVTITGVTAQNAVYDGTAHAGYTGTPQAGNYQGDYAVTYNSGSAPVNAGTYTVTIAVPDEDSAYVGSLTLTFTVAKAAVTVKAEDKTVTAGGTMPELTAVVTGLANGDTLKTQPVLTCDANLSQAGTYTITVSGAEVPEGGNYETEITYLPGTLTVRAASTGGSSGGGVVIPPNSGTGSRPSGGTTQPPAQEPESSDTTTVRDPDGNTSTTTVNPDGIAEVVVELSPATVAELLESGTPIVLPMPALPVVRDADTASIITVKTGNEAPVRVEIPVEDVTPGTVAMLLHPDGTMEPIKTSALTEAGLSVALSDGSTIKVVDNSRDFTDVTNHWAADAVDFVSARGIFKGVSETEFSPDSVLTRSMFATLLARFDGTEANGSQALEIGMSWAVEHGISDGNIPNGTITREQLVVMLYRYAGSPGVTDRELAFLDEDKTSAYARDAFCWAVENGLINGTGSGMLSPQGEATRAQAAAVLMRFCQYLSR